MQMLGLARLGRDISIRQTAAGKPVGNLALAFSYGPRAENKTQWIEAALFGDRAEKLAPYLLKGTLICVTLDNPHIETWEKKDGTVGIKLVAMVASLEFAGKSGGSSSHDEPAPAPEPVAKPKLPGNVQDMDSDIPF